MIKGINNVSLFKNLTCMEMVSVSLVRRKNEALKKIVLQKQSLSASKE